MMMTVLLLLLLLLLLIMDVYNRFHQPVDVDHQQTYMKFDNYVN